jgi:hypothetical protein
VECQSVESKTRFGSARRQMATYILHLGLIYTYTHIQLNPYVLECIEDKLSLISTLINSNTLRIQVNTTITVYLNKS